MRKLIVIPLLAALIPLTSTQAGINFGDPTGGWTYVFTGDSAAGKPRRTPGPALDGHWRHECGSDEWNGDGRGAGNGQPGGVESNNGILTIEDASTTTSGNNNNRKIYLTHGFVDDGVSDVNLLDTGVTISFRTRLTPQDAKAEIAMPNGYGIFSDGKGNFGVRQSSPSAIISFSLVRQTEDSTPTASLNFSSAGLTMNRLNGSAPSGSSAVNSTANAADNQVLPLDPTVFHEFWITIQAGSDGLGNGTHVVNIYVDGSLTPSTFYVTAGTGNDPDSSAAPTWNDYIGIGCNNSATVGAFDVDFYAYRTGVIAPVAQTTPPVASTNVVVVNGDSKVTLSWYPPWGAKGYIVLRSSASAGPYVPIATNDLPTYVDTAVVNRQYYYYMIAAYNDAGVGPNSAQVVGYPQNSPQNLVAVGGTNQVRLTWDTMPSASSFNIKRSDFNGGPYTLVASNITATTYTDTGLQAGRIYYYAASAMLAIGGEGGDSVQAQAFTAAGTPTNVAAQVFGATVARLTWSTLDSVAPTTIVQRSSNGTSFTQVGVVTGTPLVYLDPGLAGGSTNWYRLVATNASGSSVASAVVSVVMPPWGICINFANNTNGTPTTMAPTAPGYLQDIGLPFADQGNGFSYGWDIDNTANSRWRQNAASPDLRYDTFNHLQKQSPSAVWEFAITNGLYLVHLVSGDPTATDSVFQHDVEGYLSRTYVPATGAWWGEFTNTVKVTDERLTITSGPQASNNKLNFVDIYPTVPTPNVIATNPVSADTIQNHPVSFSVAVAPGGPEPFGFQWYFNNTPIDGANTATYVLATPQVNQAGSYFVVVTNAGAAVTSTVATLTVAPDTQAPRLLSAGSIDGASIGIAFDELVDPAVASDVSHYTLNGTAGLITGAVLRDNGKTIILTPATPISGTFNLAVNGMKDLAGNTAALQTVSSFVLGFVGEDVSFPSFTGYAFTSDNQNIEIAGGGADIWGNADQGYFLHRPWSGDFDARVRVTSLQGANTITKAVLAVRETMDSADRDIHISVNPTPPGRDQTEAGVRDTYGGGTVVLGNAYVPASIPNFWARIVRVGSTFAAYRSTNGVDWAILGQTNQTYTSDVILAMAVTAHDNNQIATGVFSGFSVSAPLSDLVLTKTASASRVSPGGTVTYTLAVTNVALVTAAGATITDPLPAGLSFVSANSTVGTVGESGGVVTANLGALAPGQGATVQIVASPTISGTLVNTATATATGGDANGANNVASVSILVPTPPQINNPALALGKFQFSLPTLSGMTYLVQYKNNLTDASWTTLQTVSGDGTVKTVTDQTPAPDHRFYRVVMQ